MTKQNTSATMNALNNRKNRNGKSKACLKIQSRDKSLVSLRKSEYNQKQDKYCDILSGCK